MGDGVKHKPIPVGSRVRLYKPSKPIEVPEPAWDALQPIQGILTRLMVPSGQPVVLLDYPLPMWLNRSSWMPMYAFISPRRTLRLVELNAEPAPFDFSAWDHRWNPWHYGAPHPDLGRINIHKTEASRSSNR